MFKIQLNIHWYDHVINISVCEMKGLTAINKYLSQRYMLLFARMDTNVPSSGVELCS